MAKGWSKINTVNDIIDNSTVREKETREQSFKLLINNTKTLSIKKLKEKSDELFKVEKAKEDSLLAAFDNKQLKSKQLIKQALRIKKERAKIDNKNAKQYSKNTSAQDKVVQENNEVTEEAV